MTLGELPAFVPTVVAGVVGAAVGAGARTVAARLRRGAVLRPGSVEVPTAVLAALSAALLWPLPIVWILWWLTAFGVVTAAVDLRHHRIPDAISYPVALLSLVLCAVLAPRVAPDAALSAMLRAALAALVVGACFALLALALPAAMGWGDVKLVVSLALLLGLVSWESVLLAVVVAFVLAGVVAAAGVLVRRLTGRSAIAFGPFLIAGTWVALLLAGLTERP